jgi:hypothetical protein
LIPQKNTETGLYSYGPNYSAQSKIKNDFFERTGLPALESNLTNGLRHRHQQLSMNINKATEFNKRAQRLQPGDFIKFIDEELN